MSINNVRRIITNPAEVRAAAKAKKARDARDRSRARRLATQLGCSIEPERMGAPGDSYWTYWTYGPPDVYQPVYLMNTDTGEDVETDPPRADPCDGDHAATSWGEVIDRLESYRDDLFFHERGISSEDTDDVVRLSAGEGHALLREWIDGPPDDVLYDVGAIFADWIGDQGRDDLREKILASITH